MLYSSSVIAGGVLLFILVSTVILKNTGFEGKTLWEWMELLIIPSVLAGGAFFLNRSERAVERELATDRQHEMALQTYLDGIADLLLNKNLRNSRNKGVRNVARLLTLDVLRRLDETRKGIVLKYLSDAGLISNQKTIVLLSGADLSGADLMITDLKGVNLSGAFFWKANLVEADLSGSNLSSADLADADLSNALLRGVNLNDAFLSYGFVVNADLSGADLRNAKMRSVFLNGANLTGADLTNAFLQGADFSNANLSHAKVSLEDLATARSLTGATMPDGTKHE